MLAPISFEQYSYFLFASFSTLLTEATSALTRQSNVWFRFQNYVTKSRPKWSKIERPSLNKEGGLKDERVSQHHDRVYHRASIGGLDRGLHVGSGNAAASRSYGRPTTHRGQTRKTLS
jgi:hypothetical protein